jgi:hypothetical protein
MAFLASLIGASLPITGFLVWYGRKFKKKSKKPGKSLAKQADTVPSKSAEKLLVEI